MVKIPEFCTEARRYIRLLATLLVVIAGLIFKLWLYIAFKLSFFLGLILS